MILDHPAPNVMMPTWARSDQTLPGSIPNNCSPAGTDQNLGLISRRWPSSTWHHGAIALCGRDRALHSLSTTYRAADAWARLPPEIFVPEDALVARHAGCSIPACRQFKSSRNTARRPQDPGDRQVLGGRLTASATTAT